MPNKRYKVLRDGQTWSLGYPTKAAATAAAKRLNQTSPHGGKHTVDVMNTHDYSVLADLEERQQ